MFSIIVFLGRYKNEAIAKKFFNKLSNLIQQQKNIEIIFIVEGKEEFLLNIIQNFQEKNLDVFVKFIYISKRISFDKIMLNINKLITNDYFFILDNSITMDNKSLNTLSRILKNNELDILEFRPEFSKILKWKPIDRLEQNKINKKLEINKNESIIAFTFPFIYNKVISSDLLDKTLKMNVIENNNDSSIFFSSLIYLLFLEASKYFYLPETLSNIEIIEEDIPNFNKLIQQWNSIQSIFKEKNKFVKEINYAKFFYLKVIICSLLSNNSILNLIKAKNNLIQKKYCDKLKQIKKDEFLHFELENSYMIMNNSKEVQLLKTFYPISKWNKIFKELEK